MAAVSIQDLINKKDQIQAQKQETYDLDTSIGTITVKKPTRSFVLEASKLEESGESDKYMILNLVTAPNLKDTSLQQTYGCTEPTDIVDALFDPGEVVGISKKIMECAGYGKDIKTAVHEEVKN
ncbi:hypothetical protein NXG27_04060 [Megasphaera paucivorans]|uniref:Phage XkdN-like tail assembly chaperone protein, TAC n=1 Tax=Megasphaera paucivorans TaxID=349095 RepID=A0A1G9QXU5_9FIRM|nr:hypothetical protein [Megasphaera paucivorans]SDM15065.1 Phage XkdN-like tail assembly chaperone protein, TAC [Megasphaera paucivorans]